ncbi:MAG: hypothetical protein MRZ79_14220 [Bacteroidia bacterium]|nr:hypothetical protein [Bacteroidia bacterium]
MKRIAFLTTTLILSSLILTSCEMSKILKENRTEMDRLAYGRLSKQEKFDGLANVVVDVLETSLEFDSPLKTHKYLQKFSKQNETELQSLSGELGPWIKGMKFTDKVKFTKSTLSNPYSKRLTQVVPKVQRMAKENDFELGTLEKALLLYRLRGMVKKNKKKKE